MVAKTKKIELREDAVMLRLRRGKWGNRKKVSTDLIDVDADKELISASKKLIKANELDDINARFRKLDKWVELNSMPSYFAKGFYIFTGARAEVAEDELKLADKEIKDLITVLSNVYDERVDEAAKTKEDGGLGSLFKRSDYPMAKELFSRFILDWEWLTVSVPDALPTKLQREAAQKFAARMEETAELIRQALREEFKKWMIHAAEQIDGKTDSGARKQIKDAMINNVRNFLTTFNDRDMSRDEELSKLVSKASAILEGVGSAEVLRDNDALRAFTADKFEQIAKAVDSMMEEEPTRKFKY